MMRHSDAPRDTLQSTDPWAQNSPVDRARAAPMSSPFGSATTMFLNSRGVVSQAPAQTTAAQPSPFVAQLPSRSMPIDGQHALQAPTLDENSIGIHGSDEITQRGNNHLVLGLRYTS